MTAIAIQYRNEIIEGLRSGKRISDLGLQCSRQAISKVLKNDPEYREAIEEGFHKRLDAAEKAIEDSPDGVDVARARARFEAVRWRAEREFPETWGRQAETVVIQVNAAQALDSDVSYLRSMVKVGRNRIIEHNAEQHNDAENSPTE